MNVVKMKPSINNIIDIINCQLSTPKGSLAIIIIGEVKGIIDNQKASIPSGLSITGWISINEKINGIVIGNMNC